MKNFFAIIMIILFTGCYVSCGNNSNEFAKILKQRINSAEMVEYTDTFYGAKLLYPDFFKIDSVGKYYASFSYSDKNMKDLNLFYEILPPRWIEESKEYVRRHTDSLTTFSKVKSSSFIMIQEYKYFPQIKCVFKFYKTQYGWTCYVLTYEKQYEDAVKRLVNMTKEWKIYDENIPRWISDMCDFLDL